MGAITTLAKVFVIIKLVQILILYTVPYQFDVSSDIIIDKYKDEVIYNPILTKILNRCIIWDNVYFSDLFKNPIKYEHQFVFSPGWIWFVKYVVGRITGDQTTLNFYTNVLISLIIANMCQFITSYMLYYYSRYVFNKIALFKRSSERLSVLAAVYYLISPGGIFLTMPYSENLGSFLSILALFLRELSINTNYDMVKIRHWWLYILSGIVMALAYPVRANCLLLGVFYVCDLLKFYFTNSTRIYSVLSFVTGLPLLLTFIYQNFLHYQTFCPERGEWCNDKIPSLFKYCQVHYWNNGFLNYWTMNNFPNFLISGPIIILNACAVYWFLVKFPVNTFLPYLLLNVILLTLGVFFWNIQILNRILNFNPLFYWFLATFDYKPIYIGLVVWIFIQSGLFAAFLPPA